MPASRGGLTKKKTAMKTLSSSKNIEKDGVMQLDALIISTHVGFYASNYETTEKGNKNLWENVPQVHTIGCICLLSIHILLVRCSSNPHLPCR